MTLIFDKSEATFKIRSERRMDKAYFLLGYVCVRLVRVGGVKGFVVFSFIFKG